MHPNQLFDMNFVRFRFYAELENKEKKGKGLYSKFCKKGLLERIFDPTKTDVLNSDYNKQNNFKGIEGLTQLQNKCAAKVFDDKSISVTFEGPPGTGKTFLLQGTTLEALDREQKVHTFVMMW